MAAGIYVIRNYVNGKEYVGKAVRLRKREQEHWRKLRKGCHPNSLLQHAWNKYGESAFHFELIEAVTDLSILAEREHYHADLRKPTYNIRSMGADRRKLRGFEYSELTARRVEAAYREMQEAGVAFSSADIAQCLGLSRRTVDYVLHDSEWWTGEMGRVAALAALERGRKTLAASGHPELQKAMQIHAATNYAAIRKAQKIAAATGTGSQKGRDRQAQDGYPGLKKGRETLAQNGYPNLRKGVFTVVEKRKVIQDCVFSLLLTWVESGRVSPFTTTAVARNLELPLSTASLYLRRLRAEGVIDAQNRPMPLELDS